jgi:hypothetical protein
LLGEQAVDLSSDGMLLDCKERVLVGDEVFIVFKAPGPSGLWLRADAEVARVVEGKRQNDTLYGAGLRFTRIDPRSHNELSRRLIGYPPPLPGRHQRMDYARSVLRIAYSRTLSGIPVNKLS